MLTSIGGTALCRDYISARYFDIDGEVSFVDFDFDAIQATYIFNIFSRQIEARYCTQFSSGVLCGALLIDLKGHIVTLVKILDFGYFLLTK